MKINPNEFDQIRVLYVEDDEGIRDELTIFLKRFIKDITVAKNGKEGLELYKEVQPDIIITDLRMPVMHGMEMIKEIKKLNPDVQVIVTTAHNDSGFLIEAMELGLDRYILKPVDVKILLDALVKLANVVKYERKKKESEKELKFILDLNPNFILVYADDQIKYINQTFLNFLGFADFKDFLKKENPFGQCKISENENNETVSVESWLRKISTNSLNNMPVCINTGSRNGVEQKRIFSIKTNKFPFEDKYIVTLNDITEHEKEKIILKTLSLTDSLTGIGNRAAYEEAISQKFGEYTRYNTKFSVIIFDIDHFKKINDTFGHHCGDMVLISLARIVEKNLRKHDQFFRIGGEEFIIVSAEPIAEKSALLAEKLRESIQTFKFENVEKITCSFGVAEFQDGDDIFTIFKKADKALYEAKNSGRNQVKVSS